MNRLVNKVFRRLANWQFTEQFHNGDEFVLRVFWRIWRDERRMQN